jgi:1-acyl-sn-glycerol-3-phosphate acyltransferase
MRLSGLAGDAYRYLATLQGWLLIGLLTAIGGLVLVPLTRLLGWIWPSAPNLFADVAHHMLAFYFRSVLYMRVEVEGERRPAGTRVLVANHQSWLDPLVLMGLEARLHGPVRRYMLEVPVFGWIVRQCGFFPGEVGDLPSLEVLAESVAAARARGGSLLFFPEGTRGVGGVVGPFHRGAFRVAVDHGLTLQPVVIEGLDRILPRRGPIVQLPGRSRVRVRSLEPMAPPLIAGEGPARRSAVRDFAERARSQIVRELESMRAEGQGSAGEPVAATSA